jgi:benzoate-CoA ligase
MSSAAPILLPDEFNAASYFVDRHIEDGRPDKVAIECGEVQVTYRQLFERVNQVGNGLRTLGVRIEERVFLLLLDSPEFAVSFFGAIRLSSAGSGKHSAEILGL